MSDFAVETVWLDLPALAGAFSRRLREAGVPVSAERAAAFARALTLVRPVARRRLYWTARSVFVTDRASVRAFDAVFESVFGSLRTRGHADQLAADAVREVTEGDDGGAERRPGSASEPGAGDSMFSSTAPEGSSADDAPEREVEAALGPSDEELLRRKRFDALTADELALLYRLMAKLKVAPPERLTRRHERRRHGERIDMRRTLRGSMRTAGDPVRLRRRRRRVIHRRLVLLCDISGSMEPYARAYLQFLTSAAQGGETEAFVFATRLTRLTRALASRSPERAIQNAAAAAPDWASGTRIGDALKEFNDRHGRRGLARGAVVVILSDGWERGDPAAVAREMERLARLAHKIIWVNPRAGADRFVPRAGGMVAALPYVDALVSGHSLEAMEDVVRAIGEPSGARGIASAVQTAEPEPEEEPWASAVPVPGSSVAMPSGYGPSRGRTTPGWSIGGGIGGS